jgi:Spy/CpxP family protein refolding chaperone
MQIVSKKFAALAAAATMSVATLAFGAETQGRSFHRHSALMQVLTDSQKTQAKSVFQQARETAKPMREQLMATRKSLRAAVESGDTSQIQKLSATEGQEIGQLMAIRSSAYSKIYQTLSADQKAKLAEIQQQRAQARHSHRHNAAGQKAS